MTQGHIGTSRRVCLCADESDGACADVYQPAGKPGLVIRRTLLVVHRAIFEPELYEVKISLGGAQPTRYHGRWRRICRRVNNWPSLARAESL